MRNNNFSRCATCRSGTVFLVWRCPVRYGRAAKINAFPPDGFKFRDVILDIFFAMEFYSKVPANVDALPKPKLDTPD